MTQLDGKKNKSSHSVMPRGRTALAIIVGAICLLSNAPNSAAVDDDDRYSSWFFTSEEVAAAYQYQQNYGERLRFPLRAGPCLFRGGEFSTSYRRNPSVVSCRFVLEVTRHLKEMLDAGAAKFLFPLDADHAHLGVPMEVWNNKYKNLPLEQVFPAILREPGLVALYHTAEHLRVTDRKTGGSTRKPKPGKRSATSWAISTGARSRFCSPIPRVRASPCRKTTIPTVVLVFSPVRAASFIWLPD